MDVKRKNVSSITQPREVDSRRDIELLFEDMTMQDLSKVAEKGDINAVIQLRNKKFGQSFTPDMSKNKRVKYSDENNEEVPKDNHRDDKLLEKEVIQQSLIFQREQFEFRRIRMSFTKSCLKKAMERQSIGSSGYGRFLCSHYNPGSSFISSLNSISQKYENKIKEKKRIQKELIKKEEMKNLPKPEEKKDESQDIKIEEKQAEKEKDKIKKVSKIETKSKTDEKQDLKEESKLPVEIPDEVSNDQQNKSEVKITKEAPKPKIQNKNAEGKAKPDQKPKVTAKPKEEGKVIKPKAKSSKPVKASIIDKPVEKIEEDLKNEVNIDELHKCVSAENHNDMVDSILSQNNTRISNKASKPPIKALSKAKSKDSKSDTKNNSNEGDKESGLKRDQKAESKEQDEKENKDEERKEQKEIKPKIKKVKEPKPKKPKIEKPKKIVQKTPNKERYKGSVIKKKFAPKKIGMVNNTPKSDENSSSFNVVAQIESDEEKNEIDAVKGITVITEPVLNIVTSVDQDMNDGQSDEVNDKSRSESNQNIIADEKPLTQDNPVSIE